MVGGVQIEITGYDFSAESFDGLKTVVGAGLEDDTIEAHSAVIEG